MAAARAAADSWGDISLAKRTAVLFKLRELVAAHVDELGRGLEVIEHGKVLSDAKGEIGRGLEVIEFACGIPTLLKGDYSDQVSTGIVVFSFREPLGVVAGITRSTSRLLRLSEGSSAWRLARYRENGSFSWCQEL